MKNIIAIRRGLIILPESCGCGNKQLAITLQAELMNLGFMLDEGAFKAACTTSTEWLVEYYNEIVQHLSKVVGADRDYSPFYKNFPKQVMEMSYLDLYLNAIIHYWSGGVWEPAQELVERGFAFENVSFKLIRQGTERDFSAIFTRLVGANQSLTEADKEAVEWFLGHSRTSLVLPPAIPFKETLCILAAKGLDVPIKSPTDVLRIAVYLSGGDISLPHIPKITIAEEPEGRRAYFYGSLRNQQVEARKVFRFKKFTNVERRRLLGFLEKTLPFTTAARGEMQRHLGRWLRLGEILHPGEYASAFPVTADAFKALRNQPPKIRTFNSTVDLAFAKSPASGIECLKARPGEFARRLDWMLRTFTTEIPNILNTLVKIAPRISSKVLFELWNHFDGRSKPGTVRSIMIKGKRAKMKVLEPLPTMDQDLVQQVKSVIVQSISSGFANLPPMGNVCIDERLKLVPIPFSMRSINTAVKTYVRGTRIPFSPDAKVIRPFIHWFDEDGTEDLDLGVAFYDAKLALVEHITFTNLKSPRLGSCHSGDVRQRQGPCAEYVDITMAKCLDHGVRYAMVQVHNYQQRPMHSLKQCVFGLMEREAAESNKIFVPKTISNCMGLANESSSVMVCILDLQARNYIWADIETERALPTFETTANKSGEVLRSLINGSKMSVYDLLAMHVAARGKLVDGKQNATDVTYLKWEDFVTDYSQVTSYMNFAPVSDEVVPMVNRTVDPLGDADALTNLREVD